MHADFRTEDGVKKNVCMGACFFSSFLHCQNLSPISRVVTCAVAKLIFIKVEFLPLIPPNWSCRNS